MEPCVTKLTLASSMECPSLSHSRESNTHSDTLLPPPNKSHKLSGKGGIEWDFLQSLCNKTEKLETKEVYLHPTAKRMTSKLNEKSLQMCTESLGCENGSESSDDDIISALFSFQSDSNNTSSLTTPESNSNKNFGSKRWKWKHTRFPPPLSSMRDKGGVQLRTRREDGRLLLEAVPPPSSPSFFKAERRNGRLTLRLLPNFSHDHEASPSIEEEAEEEDEEEEEGDEMEAEVKDNADEAEVLDQNHEDKTGIRKVASSSRCNENENGNYSNKQMVDWEPCWVAT